MAAGWDIHTHLIPLRTSEWARAGDWGLTWQDGAVTNGHSAVSLGRLDQPDLLLEWVASQELAGAVVSVPPPLFRCEAAASDQYLWARALNEGILETCAIAADTLKPLALVPLVDAQRALRLIQESEFGPNGFVGIVLGTDSRQIPLSSEELHPMWELISTRSIPVFIHPSTCPDPRLKSFYLTNLLGNPLETSIAVAELIFGRIMERFAPTVVLAHGGGVTPAVIGRWDRGYQTRRPGVSSLVESPAVALRHFFVDGLVYDAAALELVVAKFGIDQVLMGSDWPFPIAATSLKDALPGLDAEDLRRVQENALNAFSHLV